MEAACIRIMKNCHVSEWSSLAHARITTPLHQCGHKAPRWVSVLCLMAPRCKLCRSRGGQGGRGGESAACSREHRPARCRTLTDGPVRKALGFVLNFKLLVCLRFADSCCDTIVIYELIGYDAAQYAVCCQSRNTTKSLGPTSGQG